MNVLIRLSAMNPLDFSAVITAAAADAGLGASNRGQGSVDHKSCHIRYRQLKQQIVRTLLRREAPVFEFVQLPVTIEILELKAV